MAGISAKLKESIAVTDGKLEIKDAVAVRGLIDELIFAAVFNADEEKGKDLQRIVIEIAKKMGAVPSSIQSLYEEMGVNYPGFTVPAINIRGLAYDTARVIFKKAIEKNVGAMIFEIARSEIGYTKQRPLEYSAVVLAAAVREGYKGPVFIQGDHFQLVRKYFQSDPETETNYIKGLIKEAIEAEFYNIDIDSSTLVDLEKETLKEQQRPNFEVAAELTQHIRNLEPENITVSVGGEIGEIGGKNSTPEELRAYLDGFKETLKGGKGVSKLSVQSGTSHGGVVLPDGSLAKVSIDFETLGKCPMSREKSTGFPGLFSTGHQRFLTRLLIIFPRQALQRSILQQGFRISCMTTQRSRLLLERKCMRL
jgi:fructose/tagatose bisphosphate aldolase